MEHDVRTIFLRNREENKQEILVLDLRLLFQHQIVNIYWLDSTQTCNENQPIKSNTVGPEMCSTLTFIKGSRTKFSTALFG